MQDLDLQEAPFTSAVAHELRFRVSWPGRSIFGGDR